MASGVNFCDTCGAAVQVDRTICLACGSILQSHSSATSTGLLLPHTLLKQRYRILHIVGSGGMGAVYVAEDTQLGNRLVAVKEMSQNSLYPQEVLDEAENFKCEAHLLAGLHHPNLPSTYDHFEDTKRWYLVMSFIQGVTLQDYLAHAPGGKLPVEEVLRIGAELCTVLDYLHTQQPPIIFRDLKPSNIMRTSNGNINLIDFGIARYFKPGQEKDTAKHGSAGYTPPEQYGRAQTTPRSDIYSLGATLHQLLAGYDPSTFPFSFPPLQAQVPTLSVELTTLVMQMLEMDDSKRPASMLEVKQELQRITTTPSNVLSTSPPPKTTSRGRRFVAETKVFLSVVLIVLGVWVGIAHFLGRDVKELYYEYLSDRMPRTNHFLKSEMLVLAGFVAFLCTRVRKPKVSKGIVISKTSRVVAELGLLFGIGIFIHGAALVSIASVFIVRKFVDPAFYIPVGGVLLALGVFIAAITRVRIP